MNLKNILGNIRLASKFRLWAVSAFGMHLYGFALHTFKNKAEEIVEKKLRDLEEG